MIDIILLVLTMLAPGTLIVSSITAGGWFLDALLGLTDKEGRDIQSCGRSFIKFLQFFGMGIGILCFAICMAVLVNPFVNPISLYNDPLTIILLGVLGFVLLIAPLAKFPWSAIFGLLGGIIAAIAVAFLLPPSVVAFLPISLKWILIGIFIIVGLLIFISFKFIEDLTKAFAMLLGSRPVTLILLIIGIIQGIALIILPPVGLWVFFPW
jgi:hypothetical protein